MNELQCTFIVIRDGPEISNKMLKDCNLYLLGTKESYFFSSCHFFNCSKEIPLLKTINAATRVRHRSLIHGEDKLHLRILYFNPLNAELNTICHLLALVEARHILHVSRVRVKLHFNIGFLYRPTSRCLSCCAFSSRSVFKHAPPI